LVNDEEIVYLPQQYKVPSYGRPDALPEKLKSGAAKKEITKYICSPL
jgi:hypothetical protein